jgi:hypothetical protein
VARHRSPEGTMESCQILRVLAPDSVVLMTGTGAVVNAKLSMPMSTAAYQAAQKVCADCPMAAQAHLGEYDMRKYAFIGSHGLNFSFDKIDEKTTAYKRIGVKFS